MPQFNFSFPFASKSAGYPAILNDALVWMDEQTITESGGDVTGWTNKGTGGASYDLTPTGGTASTIQPGTVAGLATVNHSGATNRRLITGGAVVTSAPYTEYIVVKFDVVPSALTIFLDSYPGAGNNDRFAHQDNGSNLLKTGYISKGGIATIGTNNTAVNTIISTNDNAGNGLAKFGSAAAVSFTTLAGDGYSHVTLFTDRGGTNPNATSMHFCERIFFDTIHSLPNQDIVHSYLAAKWGAS